MNNVLSKNKTIPMLSSDIENRMKGCFYGCAVGDALQGRRYLNGVWDDVIDTVRAGRCLT